MEYSLVHKLCVAMIPCFLYFIIQTRKMVLFKKQRREIFLLGLFLIYLFMAFNVTGIIVINNWQSPRLDRIQLFPTFSYQEINQLLNILLFIPFGFLVPTIWKNYQKMVQTVLLGFNFSLLIEFLQLFCGRITDIDDLIMNTMGSFIGYLIWKLFYKKENQWLKENRIVGNSPIIWMFWLLFGYLFLNY